MSRRQWLFVLGAVAIALAIALLAVDPSRKGEGFPGIIDWEFAASEGRAAEILGQWGEEGQDAARLSLWLDFPYVLAFGAFFALAANATRDLARERGWDRMARFGPIAFWCALGGAMADAIEDVFLLIALAGEGGQMAPRLATTFALLKFVLLAIAISYLLAGLALRLRDHRRSQRPAAARS
jgi:hypothetical protein